MTTTNQIPLDIAAVHPKNGDKFSPNLWRWLNKRDHRKNARLNSLVYRNKAGSMHIGHLDDDGWLLGSKLIRTLTEGPKAGYFAFPPDQWTLIPDFWERYMRDGRCAIDEAHTMGFIGDDLRWKTEGDTRGCQWCGNHRQVLRKWIEPVERSRWESVS